MLENKKAVIFDLDGTLVDSMWIWPKIDMKFAKKYNITVPESFDKDLEGKSYTETAQHFLDTFPQLNSTVKEVQSEWTKMGMDLYTTKVPLKQGAGEFLAHMRSQGILLGIGTSNGRELVDALLKALDIEKYFGSVVTACEVSAGKPSPDVYLRAAENLGVAPESCLVFEDLVKGIQAGKSAGMAVCAVDDEFSRKDEEEKKQLADYFISDYYDVLNGTYEVCEV